MWVLSSRPSKAQIGGSSMTWVDKASSLKALSAKERLIVALDVDTLDKALALVRQLAPYVGMFKVGLELIHHLGGPQVTAAIHDAGGKVMYDAKLADIPNTMEGATKGIAAQGVAMFTVHASAGRKSVAAAVAAAGRSKVIGVTVLTSIDGEECVEIFGDQPTKKVVKFSENLVKVGAAAVVCSPQEVAHLQHLGLLRITPGIRPDWFEPGDQRRVLPPAEAIRNGADMLVVGRPIIASSDSVEAAQRIVAEMDGALKKLLSQLEPQPALIG